MVTMQQAIAAFVNILDGSGIRYEFHPEDRVLVMHMSIPNKLRRLVMIIGFEQAGNNPNRCIRILSMAYADMNVDRAYVSQMCEYMTRINNSLAIGEIEMNVDGGDSIRYRISAEIDDSMLSGTIIKRMLTVPLQVMEQYGDGLLAISMGLLSAKEAYQKAQNTQL